MTKILPVRVASAFDAMNQDKGVQDVSGHNLLPLASALTSHSYGARSSSASMCHQNKSAIIIRSDKMIKKKLLLHYNANLGIGHNSITNIIIPHL